MILSNFNTQINCPLFMNKQSETQRDEVEASWEKPRANQSSRILYTTPRIPPIEGLLSLVTMEKVATSS